MMTKKFIKRVMHDGCVYTRRYCYVFREGTWRWWIERIDIDALGTTKVLDRDNWQTVTVLGEFDFNAWEWIQRVEYWG